MESLRKKTSFRELKKLLPGVFVFGPTLEIRIQRTNERAGIVRKIRQAQQAENGLIEFPFGLFENGKKIKTKCMTEKEAAIRNKSIAELGMVWRRVGY